jgi:hypothetical protein
MMSCALSQINVLASLYCNKTYVNLIQYSLLGSNRATYMT